MNVTEIISYKYEVKVNGYRYVYTSNHKYGNVYELFKEIVSKVDIIKYFKESDEIDFYVENECENNYKKMFTVPVNPIDNELDFHTIEREDISEDDFNKLLYSLVEGFIEWTPGLKLIRRKNV